MPETMKKKVWTHLKLSDCCEEIAQRIDKPANSGFERFIGLEHLETGETSIRKWGSTEDVTSSMKLFRAGDVIVARRNVYLRRAARTGFDGVCSGDGIVLRAKADVCLPELMPYLLNTDIFWNYVISQADGTMSKRITVKRLLSYELALPQMEEQRRIAGALLSIDATAQSTLKLIEQIRILEVSLFLKLIEAAYPTPTPLGDLLLTSPRNGCSAPSTTIPTGHWVLALSAISKCGYRPGQLKPVEKTPEMEVAIIREGDLVVSRSNTRELVGLPAIFPEARIDVSYPDTMMRLTLDNSRLRARFLELFLRSYDGRRQVQSYAAGTSASMKKINGTNLKKVIVPLIEVREQDRILKHLSQFQLSYAENRLLCIASLKSSLLNQAIIRSEQK